MKIGYARMSTSDQKLHLQLDALRLAGCERVFQDEISSTRLERPGLTKALEQLRPGDALVVWRLDRLGRSVKGLIAFMDTLKGQQVAFVSLQEHIDTTTPHGEFFFHLLSAFAQLERSLVVERTQAGLAAARARGRRGGRPRKVTRETLRHDPDGKPTEQCKRSGATHRHQPNGAVSLLQWRWQPQAARAGIALWQRRLPRGRGARGGR